MGSTVFLNPDGSCSNLSNRRTYKNSLLIVEYNEVSNFILSRQMQWPLARYAKLRVVHAPGMPGTFSPPPRVRCPDMHHGTCVTHVP